MGISKDARATFTKVPASKLETFEPFSDNFKNDLEVIQSDEYNIAVQGTEEDTKKIDLARHNSLFAHSLINTYEANKFGVMPYSSEQSHIYEKGSRALFSDGTIKRLIADDGAIVTNWVTDHNAEKTTFKAVKLINGKSSFLINNDDGNKAYLPANAGDHNLLLLDTYLNPTTSVIEGRIALVTKDGVFSMMLSTASATLPTENESIAGWLARATVATDDFKAKWLDISKPSSGGGSGSIHGISTYDQAKADQYSANDRALFPDGTVKRLIAADGSKAENWITDFNLEEIEFKDLPLVAGVKEYVLHNLDVDKTMLPDGCGDYSIIVTDIYLNKTISKIEGSLSLLCKDQSYTLILSSVSATAPNANELFSAWTTRATVDAAGVKAKWLKDPNAADLEALSTELSKLTAKVTANSTAISNAGSGSGGGDAVYRVKNYDGTFSYDLDDLGLFDNSSIDNVGAKMIKQLHVTGGDNVAHWGGVNNVAHVSDFYDIPVFWGVHYYTVATAPEIMRDTATLTIHRGKATLVKTVRSGTYFQISIFDDQFSESILRYNLVGGQPNNGETIKEWAARKGMGSGDALLNTLILTAMHKIPSFGYEQIASGKPRVLTIPSSSSRRYRLYGGNRYVSDVTLVVNKAGATPAPTTDIITIQYTEIASVNGVGPQQGSAISGAGFSQQINSVSGASGGDIVNIKLYPDTLVAITVGATVNIAGGFSIGIATMVESL